MSERETVPALKQRKGDIDLAIRTAIEGIDKDTPEHELLQLHDWIQDICRMARQWKSEMEDAFVDYLEANGSDGRPAQIQTDTIRHYVGTVKKTKSNSDEDVLEELLNISGGDVSVITKCLSANAWKTGEVKGVLEQAGEPPEKFHQLFRVEEQPTLKNGKPNKKLMTVDERFMPAKKKG